jgi:predicted amidohydrolase
MSNDFSKTPSSNPVNFYNQKYLHTIHSAAEKDDLILKLCSATLGKNLMIVPGSIIWAEQEPVMGKSGVKVKGTALNSTYVVHNGELIYTNHKKHNVGEVDSFETKFFDFKPGKDGGTFDADSLSFGIEICADHGAIKNRLQDSQTASNIDLHLLVSDGNSMNAPAMRKGGYGLHCDRSGTFVYLADNSLPGRRRVDPTTGNTFWTLRLA